MKSFNEWLKVRNLNETPGTIEEPKKLPINPTTPTTPTEPNTPAHPWKKPKKNPDVKEDPQAKKKSK